MATIIIKNSTGSSSVPSSLVQGELAINTVTGKLYYGSGSGNSVREFTASPITSGSFSGLFSGSFIGNLTGTASWAYSASQAVTASYILSSNVYGPNGFDSVNYASNAGTAATATNVTSPLTQDLLIDGKFTTQLNSSKLANLAQNLHYYTGHTVYGTKDSGVSIGDLVYLETDNTWYQVDQTTDTSTKMLGIWVDDTTGYILLEGDIVLDQSYIGNRDYGLPVFISGSARFTCNTNGFTSGYIRAVGHPYYYYTDTISVFNWVLRFKPSNDWTQII